MQTRFDGVLNMTNERIATNWDAYYRTSFVFDPRRDMVWKEVCHFLQKKYIPENGVILDVGAGFCNFINQISGREKHAVDIVEGITEHAKPEVKTHVHSCTDLSFFNDNYFDTIFASNLLEHLQREDLLSSVLELKRVLKPNGRLILLQPNFRNCYRTYFDDYTHIQIFTDRSIKEFLESFGFRTVDLIARFLPVNMKSTLKINLPKLQWIIRCYLHLPWKPIAGQMLIVAEKVGDAS